MREYLGNLWNGAAGPPTIRVLGTLLRPMALLVIALAGCDGAESPDRRSGAVVEDSAGVTIIENGPLPPPEAGELLVPSVEIGVLEGSAEYQFFQVSDAKRLDDGAIAVTNSGTYELRIYESDGTHRATAGGAGEGPGEFGYPTSLVILPGDTIQVQDRLDRVYFTADGEFVRRETGDRQAVSELARAAGGSSEGGGWLGDGAYFVPVYQPNQRAPRPGPLYRPPMTLVRIASDLSAVDTLGEFGGILQQHVDGGGQRGVFPVVPPFSTNTEWALGSADGTIVVGDNATLQLNRFHPDGRRSIVRWSGGAVPVTDAEVEAWKDRQRNASWTQNQLPELERAWTAMDIPETRPYYEHVTAGSDGTLWVTRDDGPNQETAVAVFGPDGHFERSVRFRDPFRVHDSGPGWVLGVRRDENEVEYVHLFER